MAEEQRFQAPRLCVNNCGFFGSAATQNLCSKCFRDLQLNEDQTSSAKHALNQSLNAISSAAATAAASINTIATSSGSASSAVDSAVTDGVVEQQPGQPQPPNRCATCRRRVGITGFKCRCGFVFCGTHRYPEQHECGFDFKKTGKEEIAKANPVVKSEKLEKI